MIYQGTFRGLTTHESPFRRKLGGVFCYGKLLISFKILGVLSFSNDSQVSIPQVLALQYRSKNDYEHPSVELFVDKDASSCSHKLDMSSTPQASYYTKRQPPILLKALAHILTPVRFKGCPV